jgi:hypothetical protein
MLTTLVKMMGKQQSSGKDGSWPVLFLSGGYSSLASPNLTSYTIDNITQGSNLISAH